MAIPDYSKIDKIELDGLWSTKEVLFNLSLIYISHFSVKVLAELIESTLPPLTEIKNILLESVLPKRPFRLYVNNAGCTYDIHPDRYVAAERIIIARVYPLPMSHS
jgi:hypothetical protein